MTRCGRCGSRSTVEVLSAPAVPAYARPTLLCIRCSTYLRRMGVELRAVPEWVARAHTKRLPSRAEQAAV